MTKEDFDLVEAGADVFVCIAAMACILAVGGLLWAIF
jgi:hypothetical protein